MSHHHRRRRLFSPIQYALIRSSQKRGEKLLNVLVIKLKLMNIALHLQFLRFPFALFDIFYMS